MTNNQRKGGIIYEKIAMRAENDEQMINYEWPNTQLMSLLLLLI